MEEPLNDLDVIFEKDALILVLYVEGLEGLEAKRAALKHIAACHPELTVAEGVSQRGGMANKKGEFWIYREHGTAWSGNMHDPEWAGRRGWTYEKVRRENFLH